MKTRIKELLNTLYEAEGLLELALRRGESGYASLVPLAQQKCYCAADMAAALEITDEQIAGASADEDVAEQLFIEKVVPCLDSTDAEEQAASAEFEQEQDADDTSADENIEAVSDSAEAEAEEIMNEAEAELSPQQEEDAMAEAENMEREEDYDALMNTPSTIKAKKPVAHQKSLRSFISLNDKYLFCRELFGGSNAEWQSTMSLIESMENMDEARNFLLDDLQWNPEQTEVKTFMDTLERYFSKRD